MSDVRALSQQALGKEIFSMPMNLKHLPHLPHLPVKSLRFSDKVMPGHLIQRKVKAFSREAVSHDENVLNYTGIDPR